MRRLVFDNLLPKTSLLTCPGDISLPTDLNENFATNPANWNQPEARDNDGEPVIEASLSATQQRFYLDEVTVITYTARDETGLENTCTFSVTVQGINTNKCFTSTIISKCKQLLQ